MKTQLMAERLQNPQPRSPGEEYLPSREYWFVFKLTTEEYAYCIHRLRAVEWRRIQSTQSVAMQKLFDRASEKCLCITYGDTGEPDLHELHFVADATPSELRSLTLNVTWCGYEGVFPGKVCRTTR